MKRSRTRKSNTDLAGDLGYAEITLEEARSLARTIALRAGIPVPVVRFSGKPRKKTLACYRPEANEIVLHANGETVGDICHELGHAILHQKERDDRPHGAEFRRVFWKIREIVLPSIDSRAVKAGTIILKDRALRVRSRFSKERLGRLKKGPGGRWDYALRCWIFPPSSLSWLIENLPELYPHPSTAPEGDEAA